MLKLKDLEHTLIKPEVTEFMSTSGRSHVVLLKSWRLNPDMSDNYDNLVDQLAFAVQNKYPFTVVDRILGRISVVRRSAEMIEFGTLQKGTGPKAKTNKKGIPGVLM